MSVSKKLLNLFPQNPTTSWVAIGNFDGVHLGHQMLLNRLVQGARQSHHKSIVITFDPNPKVVLNHISEPFYLTTLPEKEVLLHQMGVDWLISLPFIPAISDLSAEAFLQLIKNRLSAAHLVVGPDFTIGKSRQGTLSNLQPTFQRLGLDCTIVDPLFQEGQLVSSGTVRQLLKAGDVVHAARLLGRYYSLKGQVIEGKGLGSKLGFPTANIKLDPMKIIPQRGVYASWANVRGQRLPAVTNVGVRPTFEEAGIPSVETLLLDFDDNICTEHLKVEFVSRLRSEQKFENLSDLITQINFDKHQARRILIDAEKS